MSAVGPWHEPMVDVAVRDHAVNDSALPQLETMQMKYRVTRCVEAIYGEVSKRIRLKSLYNSTACGTVCCTTSTLYTACGTVCCTTSTLYLQVIREGRQPRSWVAM